MLNAAFRRILALLLLGIALHAPAASLWIAGASDVLQADVANGQSQKRVALAADQLAPTSEGGVWALAANTLVYLGAGGQPRATVDVGSLGHGPARLLAADPYDHSAWIVTSGNLLLHVDTDGSTRGGFSLPRAASALAVALDQTVWVAVANELWHLSASSHLLATTPLPVSWSENVAALAVDSLTDRLWLVGTSTFARLALDDAAPPTSVLDAGGAIRGAALDPRTGILWLIVGTELIAYDGGLRRVAAIPLASIDGDDAFALTYDGANDALVLSAPSGVRLIDRDGGAVVLALPERHVIGVASPFQVLPALSLLRPPADASTALRQPGFILQLESQCSGVPCTLAPGYLASLRLIASLNGESIGSRFQHDTITGWSTFEPDSALPLGPSVFSAQVVDRFGHRSNTVESRLTVLDSSRFAVVPKANKAPTVTITSPANNAKLTAGNITVTVTATDTDGTIAKVEFFQGGTVLIGTATTAPYAIVWTSVAVGTYKLTAKATDNQNGATTSTAVNITVAAPPNVPPSVAITSPVANANLNGPSITVNATAADSDGTVAKVDFYDGATLAGTVAGGTASVSAAWTYANLAAGAHSLKATATDNAGATASATVAINVNAAPYVVITSPANCSVVDGPGNVTVTADALDTDGSVVRVEFYQGSTLLGVATKQPYAVAWPNVALGSYTLTAIATDNLGAKRTSTPVAFSMQPPNVAPSVSLTAPADGSTFGVGSPIAVSANASDDGAIAKVEFFAGTASIGAVTAAPYTVTWKPTTAGSYTLTAKATDNRGATATSNAAHVTVVTNKAPTVTLTSPANGTKYVPPATVNLAATASDSGGTIAKVEFYAGSTLIGAATSAPYTAAWTVTAGGTYSLTAKATDNLGAVTTSSAVSITVATPPNVWVGAPADNSKFPLATAFYIEGDATGSVSPIRKIEAFIAAGTGSPTSLGSCAFTGTATGPFALSWCGFGNRSYPAGNYLFTAKATDAAGASTVSPPSHVTVNSTPTVTLTAPADGATFLLPASANLAATVSQTVGNIVKVEFFADSTLIGSKTTAPYTLTWTVNIAGTYALTAKVTDDAGTAVTSNAAVVTVTSNLPPSVALTAPADGSAYIAPATVNLSATASDSDGIARVEFYAGSTLVGSASNAPYNATWTNAPGGSYALTARAIDNRGGTANSSPVNISIDKPPVVTITSPANNSAYAAGSTVPVSVHATDADGTLTKVELLRNGVVIATVDVPANVNDQVVNVNVTAAGGSYVFTARATDNLGAVTTSAPVTVNVRALSVSLTRPDGNVTLVSPGDIRLAATPTVSGGTVAKVEFFANGSLLGAASLANYGYYWYGVPSGQYTLTARVTDDSGLTATSAPVSVTVQAAPAIAAAGGLDGSTVNDAVVNVTGTFQAPPNSGVAVNGVAALLDDSGHFYADNIPLALGANTLVLKVTTPDGRSANQSIQVNSTGPAAFSFAATPTAALGALVSAATLKNSAGVAFDHVELDVDSNGTIDLVATPLQFVAGALHLQVTYPSAGIWTLSVRVKDDHQQVIYTTTRHFKVIDPGKLDALLQGVYFGVVDRLRVGNVSGALQGFTASAADRFSTVFANLQSSLSTVADQIGTLQSGVLGEEMAEYAIVRSTPTGTQAFLMYLIRGSDGIWRIDVM